MSIYTLNLINSEFLENVISEIKQNFLKQVTPADVFRFNTIVSVETKPDFSKVLESKTTRVLIESTPDSTRVSWYFISKDDKESEGTVMQSVMKRIVSKMTDMQLNSHSILRKNPIPGYHISFLFTSYHLKLASVSQLILQMAQVRKLI